MPINIHDEFTCEIKQQTQVAELLSKCFEAVDRSLCDILQIEDAECVNRPFVGKVVLVGGDFRQILPVVRKGRKEDIVYSVI